MLFHGFWLLVGFHVYQGSLMVFKKVSLFFKVVLRFSIVHGSLLVFMHYWYIFADSSDVTNQNKKSKIRQNSI